MIVLIKGIDMPTSCGNCWALDDYGDYPRCRITEEQRGYNFPIREKRMDNCPIVSIPPHGRLGDIDELAKRIEYERYHHEHTDGLAAQHHVAEYLHFLKAIADTPTIIPADKEGKE